MSLPYALLTALAEKSSSGLELARRFDKSIGYFWSASHQQIYRELSQLEKAGLIKSEAQPNSQGQKKNYKLLPSGREKLQLWISSDDDGTALRDSLMVRMRAEAALGSGGIEATLQHRLQAHHEKLERYREIEARDFSCEAKTRAQALQHLILTAGIRHELFWTEFLDQALITLNEDYP